MINHKYQFRLCVIMIFVLLGGLKQGLQVLSQPRPRPLPFKGLHQPAVAVPVSTCCDGVHEEIAPLVGRL